MKTACPECGQQYVNLPQIADNKMTTCTSCSAQFVIRDPVGRSLSRETNIREWQVDDVILNLYVVKEILGQGGFGKVYRLFHRAWELDLAVKTPNQKAIAAAGGVENFEREAETWVNLGLHPHTVSCYYVRRIDNIPRVFSEYVSGGDLSGWIKTGKLYQGGKKKSLNRMIDIAIQFAWGLHYAHEQKLIHQDVKPANLMLTEDETAKVTDFGLARAKAMSDMHSGGDTIVVKGSGYTPEYASPEQISGSKLTRRTDIWSWAVSILEMFCGERTWRSGTVAGYQLETYLKIGPSRKDLPEMPETIGNLLQECLREDPEQRPRDLQSVSQALIEIYHEVSGKPYPRKPSSAGRDTADSLNNRAISMLDLGRNRDAEATWKRALNIQAYHPESTYNRGLSHWHDGTADDENLIQDMEKVVQMAQPEWLGRLLLARVHLERGDCESALDMLGDINDQEVTDINYKGVIRRASNNLQKSRRRLSTMRDRWPVKAIAFSAVGKIIISGGLNRTVDLWDSSSGIRTASIEGHTAPITSIVVTSDGSRAFTGSLNAEVRQWNLHKKQLIKTYKDHLSAVTCISLSHDNKLLLTGSEDQAIHISSVDTHTHVLSLHGHRDTITSISVDLNNQRVLSGSHDHTLRLWDMQSGNCLHVMQGHTDKINAACLSRDNQFAISGSSDKTIRIWNLNNGKCLHTLTGNTSPVTALAMTLDDLCLLSGNQQGTLKLWDLKNRQCVSTFIHAHKQSINAIRFHAGSYEVATAGQDKSIQLWDMSKGFDYQAPVVLSKIHSSEAVQTTQEKFNTELDLALKALAKYKPLTAANHVRIARKLPGFTNAPEAVDIWRKLYIQLSQNRLVGIWERGVFSGHEGSIHSVCTNMQGTLVLSGGEDASVRLWDIANGNCIQTFLGHEGAIRAVALSHCGRYAISASDDKTLKLWNIDSSSNQLTYKGHQASVTCLVPTPNNRYLFSGSEDKTLKLWDLQHGRILRTYNGHREAVTSCWITPDGQYALSGSKDRTIRLWDIASGDSLITVGTFKGHIGPVTTVCGSYDARYALSASEDGDIRVWNIQRDQCIRTLRGHESTVTSMALSVDNHYVLSGSIDGKIKLWDLRNGDCLHTISGGGQPILSTSLSMDNGFILSAGEDEKIHLWVLDWELEDTKGHWDKGAIPYLEAFLKQHTPQPLALSYKTDLSIAGDGKSLSQTGLPVYGERDLKKLYYTLGCAGYHKIEPARIQSELQNLTLKLKEEKEKETDITSRRTITDFAKEKSAKTPEILKRKKSSINWVKHVTTFAISAVFILIMLLLYNFYTQSVEETELQATKELINQGENINSAVENGQTLLHLAVRKGQLSVAEFLIENGAHISKRDDIHWTPLHYAVNANNTDMVKLLLAKGANINLVAGQEKITPLMLAQDNENEEIIQILNDAKNKNF